MKNFFRCLAVFSVCLFLQNAIAQPVTAAGAGRAPAWRAVMVISGPFVIYQRFLATTAHALDQLNVIENGSVPSPEDKRAVAPLWDWLADNAGGDSIRFLKDGLYDYQWQKNPAVTQKLVDRINQNRDVDLIIALGTYASAQVAEKIKNIPIISFVSTNAITSGLVKSAQDSGQDNLHVTVEPNRFAGQIEVFHELFRFKRMGFVYVFDASENQYENDKIKPVCDRLGVTFKPCGLRFSDDAGHTLDGVMQCVRQLVERDHVDAIAFSAFNYPDNRKNEVADYMIQHQLPSFSLAATSSFVSNGLLAGLDQSNLSEIGEFEANVIQSVLAGETPRNINQIFSPQHKLNVNLTTAMALGWHIPFDLFTSIGSTHQFINRPDE